MQGEAVKLTTLEELLCSMGAPGYAIGRQRAFAEVIRQGEAICANEQNDHDTRKAIALFIDRFRGLAAEKRHAG